MSELNRWRWEKSREHVSPAVRDVGEVIKDLCEKALNEANAQLHPPLRSVDVERLSQRNDFLQAFKSALEKRIAQKLADWQPGVQAIFKFDETWADNTESWDGSIHLLVKVPRLSNTMTVLGKTLDRGLVKRFRQLGWSRVRKRHVILDVQQVTPMRFVMVSAMARCSMLSIVFP